MLSLFYSCTLLQLAETIDIQTYDQSIPKDPWKGTIKNIWNSSFCGLSFSLSLIGFPSPLLLIL